MVNGENILLDLRNGNYYTLNITAGRVWRGLEQNESFDQIARALKAEFDIGSEINSEIESTQFDCAQDITAIIANFKSQNLLDEQSN